jgi:hypothetical protein
LALLLGFFIGGVRSRSQIGYDRPQRSLGSRSEKIYLAAAPNAAATPQFTVESEAVLNRRPRLAIGSPYLFECVAVLALEAAIADGVVGIIEAGDHVQHLRRRLLPMG